jgi:predicted DNA-binding protein
MVFNLRGREPRPNRMEFRLSDAELERLDQACARLDRTGSAIVRLALSTYLDRLADEDAPFTQHTPKRSSPDS